MKGYTIKNKNGTITHIDESENISEYTTFGKKLERFLISLAGVLIMLITGLISYMIIR